MLRVMSDEGTLQAYEGGARETSAAGMNRAAAPHPQVEDAITAASTI